MPTIFIGLLALALVLWLAKSFARVDPKYMIRVGRTAGGLLRRRGQPAPADAARPSSGEMASDHVPKPARTVLVAAMAAPAKVPRGR
jgi:hypothetical protein